MKLKGRTILILALLLFGGFAVYDFYQDKKNEEKTVEDSRLMTVNFEQVDSFQIQKGDSKIVLKRTVNGWELIEPIKDLADNTAADDFVKNTFPERIIEVAKAGEGIDWALYGLTKPLGTVLFSTSAGTKNTFEISEKKNFEDNVFARRDGENKVLLLNSVWQSRVNKTVNDFRDRRFLRHKIASVDRLELNNDKGTLKLERTNGVWNSPDKKELKLDQNKVRETLSALADAKAAELFGYDKKINKGKLLFTLQLILADKKWDAIVTQDADLGIYAKVSEPQFQMKMDSGALDKFLHLSIEDLKEQPPAEKKDKK